jgi:hypothetical protein
VNWPGRDQVDRLRAVPLEAVLPLCGGTPDPNDPQKWHTPAGTLSVAGAKFMNWSRGRGGGGAIDLVIELKSASFLEAVAWLGRHFAGSAPEQSVPWSSARALLQLPPPDLFRLDRVRDYLARQRWIAPPIIEALVASGDLYADGRTNAVFALRSEAAAPVGAELRGTSGYWRGMAPGSRKDLGFFAVGLPAAATVILCESAIDAISAFQLHQGCRAVSTSGARPDPAWLPRLLASHRYIACGFDTDPTGERTAAQLIARHPAVHRLRPPLHDWNDALRAASLSA